MAFFQNTRKPEGLGGKLMVTMMNHGHASLSAFALQHIAIQENASCLDLGCGGGANVKKLLARSPQGHVTGLDYSEVSVAKSRKCNAAAIEAGRCEIVLGNVMDLPFPDDAFHVATAFETIYFWPDLAQAFAQVFRVLKPNGLFLLCNEASGADAKGAKWASLIEGMRVYSSEDLRRLLRQAGFSNLKMSENPKGWLCIVAEKKATPQPKQPL